MRIGILLSLIGLLSLVSNGEIRTAQDVRTLSYDAPLHAGETFRLTAQVLSPCSDRTLRMSVRDDTGACMVGASLKDALALKLRRGDRVCIQGHFAPNNRTEDFLSPQADEITLLSRGTLPPPVRRTAQELFRGDLDCQTVRLDGTVRDVLTDEIDPNFTFIVLDADGETVYAPLLTRRAKSKVMTPPPGSRVSVFGIADPYPSHNRRLLTHYLNIIDAADITVLTPAPTDPFDVPDISTLSIRRPEDILAATGRYRAHGTVVALWKKDTALVRTGRDRFLRAEFAQTPVPDYGTTVDIVGFPETDLYQVNLSRAIWRTASTGATGVFDEPAHPITLREMMNNPSGAPQLHPEHRGQLLSVRGTVKSISSGGIDGSRLYLESDDYLLPVELDSFPHAAERIPIGAIVEVTGICILDLENWRPNVLLPRIRGISLYLRGPEDLKIVSLPPWWTRERLFTALGLVLVVLAGFTIWNLLLRRLAERRGNELLNENAARLEAECRIDERTRLAVELHDSLSQTLSGISMHIDSALRFFERDRMIEKLSIAAQMLQSCREELRNCLWDLRNRALDEPDMAEAIRRTLKPQTGDAELSIRFCVPRKEISDDTAHIILRILRELASNAVRHGRATRIRIAGAYEPDVFKLSVQDNGTGFDVPNAPGMAQGHFGLQGIRERLKTLGGTMSVISSPQGGTKVIMTFRRITKETLT